jgi:hypothetical protein
MKFKVYPAAPRAYKWNSKLSNVGEVQPLGSPSPKERKSSALIWLLLFTFISGLAIGYIVK